LGADFVSTAAVDAVDVDTAAGAMGVLGVLESAAWTAKMCLGMDLTATEEGPL
jgi:hypothetical protein